MKTQLSKKLWTLTVLIPALSFAQDANLSLGNLSSYYNTYDISTKMITGIELVVGADGTNSNNYISSDFETSLYLLACDNSGTPTSSTPIIIATYTLTGGTLHQMGTYTWSNQSVDLGLVSGLADGKYRMGAWVNSNAGGNGIANPPDDQSDNAGLLQSSIGTSSGSIIDFSSVNAIKYMDAQKYVSLFPVPATNDLFVKLVLDNEQAAIIEIYDISAKLVQTVSRENLVAGNHILKTDISAFENGIYFVKIKTADKSFSKKFVINR